MSGVFGPCDRACELGQPHKVDCRNHVDVGTCPGCGGEYGRHNPDCILHRSDIQEPT